MNRFEEQKMSYLHSNYNETLTRRDFIDPFFKALGWDMDNENSYAESYREVIHEDRIKVAGANKAPDYSFRLIGGKRLFFVEAKKPSVIIKDQVEPAFQVRRYGWSARLPVSIVTDFQEFAVYDCTKKPLISDKASTARIKYLTYSDYLNDFDFIWDTFSRERVLQGSFDHFVTNDKYKKGTSTLDGEFLESLDNWRTELAKSICKSNRQLDEEEINFVVQQILDRIIFLRIAEDRSIEPYGNLKNCIQEGNLYQNLFHVFTQADDKYNSGLFDFNKDQLSKHLEIENKVLKAIITDLYYPSPYAFDVFPVEILGTAYEQFLGKQIKVSPAHKISIEQKPEVRKAGGVYYTPQYIVNYIVENTVGKLIAGKTPKEIESIKIVDPACGSGSFLLGAYDYLLKFHKDHYTKNGRVSKGGKRDTLTPEGNLTTNEKKRILLNNIYGVDIDTNAVEVTKLSLLIKCMEGETEASIATQMQLFHERVLPTLDNNIKSGNSLIGTDYYDHEPDLGDEKKIRPFNWQKAFPEVFEQGGFDAVIGNPPYVRIHELKESEKEYFTKKYFSAEGQFDLYQLFYEKGISLISKRGSIGFITSNKFCVTNYGKNLRHIIFEKCRIEKIVDCSAAKVFGDASTYPYIFILKNKFNEKQKTQLYSDVNKSISFLLEIDQLSLLKGDEKTFSFTTISPSYNIIEKIEKKTTERSHFVYRGRGTSKDISETKEKIKSITNREIERYSLKKGIYWRKKDIYENDFEPKILMKKICFNIECAYDITGEINPINTVYVIKPNSEYFEHEYLLGILNSKLLSFYARIKYSATGMRGGYIELRVFEVAKLPIIIPDRKTKDEIIKHVQLLLKLNEDLKTASIQIKNDQARQRIEYSEERINRLVYQLYDLSPEEIKTVEESFKG